MNNEELFIEKIANIVTSVFEDYRGIKPSVIIAQAILESGFGTSELSKYNNIFGLNNYADGYLINAGFTTIKVPQEKNGKIIYCYETMATFDSIEDCVKSLKKWYTRPKYIENLNGKKSSREQIEAIKNSGYATDSGYVDKIINIIKKYSLEKYDTCFAVQCGAFEKVESASVLRDRLNKVFKDNTLFYVYYSRFYTVRYNRTHNKKVLSEWLEANKNLLPRDSFITERW